MMRFLSLLCSLVVLAACDPAAVPNPEPPSPAPPPTTTPPPEQPPPVEEELPGPITPPPGQTPPPPGTLVGCDGQWYTPPAESPYVLPFPIDAAYVMSLGNCSSVFHNPSAPDRYAYDFRMPIGTLITAARPGRVVYVEESGIDGNHPNNLVVVEHGDDTYGQYMHLTQNGALAEIGEFVERGDPIGLSGNTGLSGSPHLHFIVTTGNWTWPYAPVPVTFSNAVPGDTILVPGVTYTAESY